MCKDCPFKVTNILKYKVNIYDDVKDKNRGKLHKCHTRKNKLCSGFIKEAKDRNDIDLLTNNRVF